MPRRCLKYGTTQVPKLCFKEALEILFTDQYLFGKLATAITLHEF